MKKIVLTLTTTALLSSCGIYTKYERPSDIKTDGLYGTSVTETTDSIGLAALPWRSMFTDPTLQSLIEKGLQNNTDMRKAALSIDQAEASLKAAKLSFFPSLAIAPQGALGSVDWAKANKTYTIPLSASWQIDIFGSLRNAKKRAQMQLESSKAYKQAVQTQLVAAIANYYYTLSMLDEQLAISKKTGEIWKENIKIYQSLMNVGQTNAAAVAQAEGNYYNICAQIIDLEHQIIEVENSFSTLLAEPASKISRQNINNWQMPQRITAGVPSCALANRPDVKNAELALASAFYTTNAARSAFYPALNLSGMLGWTNDLGQVINPGKWIWQAAASLAQPIFQNGKLRANLKISKAQQEQAKLTFQQTLLNAGAEVNTAMAKIQSNIEKEDLNDKRIASMEQAVKSTQLLMQNSSTNYLEVLTAQQSLLSAQLSKISTQFAKIQGTIELYQALGGGAE